MIRGGCEGIRGDVRSLEGGCGEVIRGSVRSLEGWCEEIIR